MTSFKDHGTLASLSLLRNSLAENAHMFIDVYRYAFFVIFTCREIEGLEIVTKSETPFVKSEKDTYLTLEILAAILEKLSETGMSIWGSN